MRKADLFQTSIISGSSRYRSSSCAMPISASTLPSTACSSWRDIERKDKLSNTNEPTELSFAFTDCVDSASAIARVFNNDFVHHGYLSYCFNLVWVALGRDFSLARQVRLPFT